MTLLDQIEAVRDSGEANMFDTHSVQVVANDMNLYGLVTFIELNREKYFKFIATGNADLLEES